MISGSHIPTTMRAAPKRPRRILMEAYELGDHLPARLREPGGLAEMRAASQ
jgi:hypothetical protein